MRREDLNKELEENIKKEEKKEKNRKISKKIFKVIVIILLLITLFFLYMHFIGTKGLKVKEYKVTSTRLPESFNGLKIVHFSDIYYLSNIKENELKNVVNKINELKPDIIVFTGDIIDTSKDIKDKDIETITKYLKKLDAKIGKYAVKGDMDYNNYYETITTNSNFQVINNSYELIYYKGNDPILLTGTGSCLKTDCDINQSFSFNKIDNIFTISLVHEPDTTNKIISNKPDLILSGHSLNGQIRLPFIGGIVKVENAKKYKNSKYNIGNTTLFISGGLGTNKYEFRLFNHPSINFYRLVKETN